MLQPDQYLWVHRRFKNRPEGEADVYQVGAKKKTQQKQITQQLMAGSVAQVSLVSREPRQCNIGRLFKTLPIN